MRTGQQITVSVANNTVYSDGFRVSPDCTVMGAVAKRASGAVAFTVTLQGGMDPASTVTDDWADLDFLLAAHNADTPASLVNTDFEPDAAFIASWPAFRFEVQSAGTFDVVIQTVEV